LKDLEVFDDRAQRIGWEERQGTDDEDHTDQERDEDDAGPRKPPNG
jgi:hypothetical protein